MRVIHAEHFFHDGRGPTLIKVHVASQSTRLLAIDFETPDGKPHLPSLHHLEFVGAQSYMFTPEEVEDSAHALVDWTSTNTGALVSLGQSAWLQSFSAVHLEQCEHYKAMFYDEYLDVICERVLVREGAFEPSAHDRTGQ